MTTLTPLFKESYPIATSKEAADRLRNEYEEGSIDICIYSPINEPIPPKEEAVKEILGVNFEDLSPEEAEEWNSMDEEDISPSRRIDYTVTIPGYTQKQNYAIGGDDLQAMFFVLRGIKEEIETWESESGKFCSFYYGSYTTIDFNPPWANHVPNKDV